MSAAALVIAGQNVMRGRRERVKVDGDVLTFADTEPIQALQTIMEERPGLVVLERLFAATPRGAALINRIKSDPDLAHAEVRVMSHTGDYTRQVVKPSRVAAAPAGQPAGPATALSAQASGSPAPPRHAPNALAWRATPRAPRLRATAGAELPSHGHA